MKECIRCGEINPLMNFYTHPRMADGRLNKCKDCCKRDARLRHYQKATDPEWVIAERERGREKYRRFGYGRGQKQPHEMTSARTAALRDLPGIPSGMERHHWSYNEGDWTDVILLDVGCHRALHTKMTYDPDSRYFRTPRGWLLDTKRKHLRWMNAVLNERSRFKAMAA